MQTNSWASWKWTTSVCLVAAALAGCGGGGGNEDTGGTDEPPDSGDPTTVLTDSAETANALGAQALSGAELISDADSAILILPAGVRVSPPMGVTGTETIDCGVSGNVKVSFDLALSGSVAGWSATTGDSVTSVYNQCTEYDEWGDYGDIGFYTYNGTYSISYDRWVNENDFTISISTENLTLTYGGQTKGPWTLAETVTNDHGTYSRSVVINGATVIDFPTVYTDGSVVSIESGTVRRSYGSGWIEWNYNNFSYDSSTRKPLSGSVSVTGSGGSSALITVTGSSSYNVTLTVNGVSHSYTVAF